MTTPSVKKGRQKNARRIKVSRPVEAKLVPPWRTSDGQQSSDRAYNCLPQSVLWVLFALMVVGY